MVSEWAEKRVRRAVAVLQEAIAAGAMPGAVVCVLRYGELLLHEAIGTRDNETATTTDTLYDLASITKPMATGAVLLTLVEDGHLTLTTPLSEYLGDRAGHLQNVTLFHLLTHTSGLPAWTACYNNGNGLEAAVAAILRQPVAQIGTKYEYSCLNFILLQRVLETATGKPLDALFRERIAAPLGLALTAYCPLETFGERVRERIAPTVPKEGPNAGETLVGIVHDGNARGIGGVSGNAGLFGTAAEVAKFGESLRASGAGGLFGTPTLNRVLQNQIKPEVGAHTLLFFAQGNGFCPAGDLLSPQTVGHSGYTGTLLTIDPTYHLTIVLLTNSVFPMPVSGDGKARFLLYRRRFLNTLAASLS